MTDVLACRRALLSVSDKFGLVPFAARLASAGVQLVSTGGTARVLRDAGLDVTEVQAVTDFPECFDGRVKTLHPMIHGGLLFDRANPEHQQTAERLGVTPIDLLVVNLYPFERTVERKDCTWGEAIENIDIGGPAMVRAAAKNHAAVTVITSPDDYEPVVAAIEEHGGTPLTLRRRLALEAYRHTARYDAAIALWMAQQLEPDELLPSTRPDATQRRTQLRYGENPHQSAALYTAATTDLIENADVLQGRELSYNNLVDLDAAIDLVREFDEPAAAVVKHTNPCGTGRHAESIEEAWQSALAADPVSAFGGIVAVNRVVERSLAEKLAERFLEVVAAPGFSDEAMQVLATKKNLRVIRCDPRALALPTRARSTFFGTLVQTADPTIAASSEAWNIVTTARPDARQEAAMRFLWRVCKHVKSNAIVVGDDCRTFGVGAGQMSRVDAVELAVRKATAPLDGAVLASDAFFPFRDGLDAAARAGVRAVIQPGGSRRDEEVIAAANEHGLAMVFTGTRHFRH
ncbi:MAG: bifunctional phosphoribosylaminoimidazolecarboxamide formyltransferase/IMP cyclohydrolase PurH [Deltaproteobacteria bacterium]|nr:MAG: bifunctional phosphoribosylaminoimidazolecarboxamide formyltransferase/IMP cyclohydrolase PurH [Deltaproteobacteria bacterium]